MALPGGAAPGRPVVGAADDGAEGEREQCDGHAVAGHGRVRVGGRRGWDCGRRAVCPTVYSAPAGVTSTLRATSNGVLPPWSAAVPAAERTRFDPVNGDSRGAPIGNAKRARRPRSKEKNAGTP